MNSLLPILKTENLSFSYGNSPLIQNLSLTLTAGDSLLISGPNGCGKSTLLQLLSGLLAPQAGKVTLNTHPLSTYSPRNLAQHIAYTDTQLQTVFRFSVKDIISMGRYPYHGQDPQNKIKEAIKLFDLHHLKSALIETLSTGEKQRCALAKLWVQEAPIWLLDEVIDHIDHEHRLQFIKLMQTHLKNNGSIILVSHHIEPLLPVFKSHLNWDCCEMPK